MITKGNERFLFELKLKYQYFYYFLETNRKQVGGAYDYLMKLDWMFLEL